MKFFALCLYVLDGDTINCWIDQLQRTVTIRLLYIDTEESREGGKPATALGLKAKQYLSDRLTSKTVHLEFDCNHANLERCLQTQLDVYNRVLAYVSDDSGMINLDLVHSGYSPYFTKYGYSQKHHQRFLELANYAQVKRRGIWGERLDEPKVLDYKTLQLYWNRRADQVQCWREQVNQYYFPHFRDNRCRLVTGQKLYFFFDGRSERSGFRKGLRVKAGIIGNPFAVFIQDQELKKFLEKNRGYYLFGKGQLGKYRGGWQVWAENLWR